VRYGASYTLKQRGRGAFPDVAEAIMTHPDGGMVDTQVLGTCDVSRVGSSPTWGTKNFFIKNTVRFCESKYCRIFVLLLRSTIQIHKLNNRLGNTGTIQIQVLPFFYSKSE
jgi:hypothetical protein